MMTEYLVSHEFNSDYDGTIDVSYAKELISRPEAGITVDYEWVTWDEGYVVLRRTVWKSYRRTILGKIVWQEDSARFWVTDMPDVIKFAIAAAITY